MTVRNLILSAWVLLAAVSASSAEAPAEPAYRRGVNLAGPEFGKGRGTLHKDYTFNNEATFKYFAEQGFDVFRVPVKWGRLQHELGGELDEGYFGMLKQNIAWAKAHGAKVLIDLHDYGRRGMIVDGQPKSCIVDHPYDGKILVKASDLAELWVRLSTAFKDEPAVYGYGLMNEPHGMGEADWKAISNVVVKAIRANGDKKLILVAGDHWSNAGNWEKHNGPASWVEDPDNNFMYEAHCYFDQDMSGQYKKTYAEELEKNKDLAMVGAKRVGDFIAWCKKNNVRGFIGEFGVPDSDPRWYEETLENFMRALNEAGMGGTYWAGGTYWGKYPMSIQPTEKFTVHRPQMAVLRKHLTPKVEAVAKPEPEAAK